MSDMPGGIIGDIEEAIRTVELVEETLERGGDPRLLLDDLADRLVEARRWAMALAADLDSSDEEALALGAAIARWARLLGVRHDG